MVDYGKLAPGLVVWTALCGCIFVLLPGKQVPSDGERGLLCGPGSKSSTGGTRNSMPPLKTLEANTHQDEIKLTRFLLLIGIPFRGLLGSFLLGPLTILRLFGRDHFTALHHWVLHGTWGDFSSPDCVLCRGGH